MKKLLLISVFFGWTISYAQDYIQTTSIRVNPDYYTNIKSLNRVYEYEADSISIELFQEIDDNEEDYEINDGLYSIIKINDYYLPFKLGDLKEIKLLELVNSNLPEIVIYSNEVPCWADCGNQTYVINLRKKGPFILTDLGTGFTIIKESGKIDYYIESSESVQTYEYNYNKGENEFFVRNSMFWNDEGCYDLIQSIEYNETLGYSNGIVKKKVETMCAACFTGEMQVSINEHERTPISSLVEGDQILTFDFVTKRNKIVTIEGIIQVPHNIFVEYYFSHDTIISTLDHPFYLDEKGWSSFDPDATSLRYNNYKAVDQITPGDNFILKNGNKVNLNGFSIIKSKKASYTITKLSSGENFYVNDILVGVEHFDHPQKLNTEVLKK